jgi:hypothetical protein
MNAGDAQGSDRLMTHLSGSLILRPSKRSVWKLVLICLGFTGIGVWMIAAGEGIAGWFVALFFGAGLVVALAQFWPVASYLKLTAEGFVCCTLFRHWSAGWESVGEFSVGRVGHDQRVIFERYGSSGTKFLPDGYGRTAEELADLMNDWRRGGSSDDLPLSAPRR